MILSNLVDRLQLLTPGPPPAEHLNTVS